MEGRRRHAPRRRLRHGRGRLAGAAHRRRSVAGYAPPVPLDRGPVRQTAGRAAALARCRPARLGRGRRRLPRDAFAPGAATVRRQRRAGRAPACHRHPRPAGAAARGATGHRRDCRLHDRPLGPLDLAPVAAAWRPGLRRRDRHRLPRRRHRQRDHSAGDGADSGPAPCVAGAWQPHRLARGSGRRVAADAALAPPAAAAGPRPVRRLVERRAGQPDMARRLQPRPSRTAGLGQLAGAAPGPVEPLAGAQASAQGAHRPAAGRRRGGPVRLFRRHAAADRAAARAGPPHPAGDGRGGQAAPRRRQRLRLVRHDDFHAGRRPDLAGRHRHADRGTGARREELQQARARLHRRGLHPGHRAGDRRQRRLDRGDAAHPALALARGRALERGADDHLAAVDGALAAVDRLRQELP